MIKYKKYQKTAQTPKIKIKTPSHQDFLSVTGHFSLLEQFEVLLCFFHDNFIIADFSKTLCTIIFKSLTFYNINKIQ